MGSHKPLAQPLAGFQRILFLRRRQLFVPYGRQWFLATRRLFTAKNFPHYGELLYTARMMEPILRKLGELKTNESIFRYIPKELYLGFLEAYTDVDCTPR